MTPERIFLNAVIRTLDPSRPLARAVAVGNGRILAVGDNTDIASLSGPDTETLDLGGRLVLPGFMDSHFHYYDWSMGRKQLNLADATSFQDCLERVAEAARGLPEGAWVLGQGWNESDWEDERMPTRHDLDHAAPNHPVALWRCDLHLATVNSLALERAGIDENTIDPPDGVIARDAAGRPSGILRELAPNLVKAVIHEAGDPGVYEAMLDGIPALHTFGLTGLFDVRLMGGVEGPPAFRTWQRIREEGKLDLRCWVSLPGERLEEAVALGLRSGLGDDRLRIGHLKYFMDGGMGARTAWMVDPYLDGGVGMPLCAPDALREWIVKADRAGLAVMVHAIGERANREIVSVFEAVDRARVLKETGPTTGPAVPHRVEHIQMIRPEDLARMARLNIVGCVQPHNLILDIHMVERSVGERGRWTYAYRSMLDAGIPLIMSSDAPVCNPRPLVGIHAAVTRRRRNGSPEGGWYPEERITVEEAVRAYTLSAAEANGVAQGLGSVSPGKRADLVVLDRDIFAVDPMEIAETNVDMTVFDGRVVFSR
ncbi:MAG: amidohydrolase [Deltaproteobacteria bacterium]|nr:amidohydrolase [Deltaproteobacteria bacterium]